jgi:MFS transporter, MFS domain-containing protein family, molybdate-anion transporter
MDMDLYRSTFLCLLALNGVVLYRSWRSKTVTPPPSPTRAENEKADVVEHRGRANDEDAARVSRLKWKFIPVFLLVNGADWLQGPYIYPIYKGTSFRYIIDIGIPE